MKIPVIVALVGIVVVACGASKPLASTAASSDHPDEVVTKMPDLRKQEGTARAEEGTAFTRVEPSKVCMINNQYMGSEQIPVVVQGKTYFGCCKMCEAKLAEEPSSRIAQDPISGRTVDKATAVIGSDPSGAVQYFENDANLEKYASR